MSTAIRHLDCASMHPGLSLGGRLTPARMVAHCLLIEGAESLTLVDTGFGTEDIRTRRMGRAFITSMGLRLDQQRTAVAQLRALGHDPADVRDIVLTHLDLDHAGGLGDFPQARVHVFADELAAATRRATLLERQRYLTAQWAHGPRWVEHSVDGEQWLGFDSVRALGEDVLLVPLRGHTRGHCGVAVRRPGGTWFLHAGDSYFAAGEMRTPPSCPIGLTGFQLMMQVDGGARRANQERLRALAQSAHEPVTIFSAHDAVEFDALSEMSE